MVHLAPHLFFYPALLKFHENTVKYEAPFWGIITTGKNVERKDYYSRNQVYILVHALNFQRWVPDLQGDVTGRWLFWSGSQSLGVPEAVVMSDIKPGMGEMLMSVPRLYVCRGLHSVGSFSLDL